MQRLGGWYGFVTWHGEKALMSHDVFLWRRSEKNRNSILGCAKNAQKASLESIEEISM